MSETGSTPPTAPESTAASAEASPPAPPPAPPPVVAAVAVPAVAPQEPDSPEHPQHRDKGAWKPIHTFTLLGLAVGLGLIAWKMPSDKRLLTWYLTMALLAGFTVIAGKGTTGLWRGAFIDERNKISLSRLQLFLWTVVILSGFLAAGLGNAKLPTADPLAIEIPQQLWLMLGISATSLVGSPLIRNNKAERVPQQAEMQRTQQRVAAAAGVPPNDVTHRGQLLVNKWPSNSRWSDLVRGEETGNGYHLDLAKVQLFFFTLVLVVAYAAALGSMLGDETTAVIRALPAFDSGMVALLGISHAGYLGNKAVSHSKDPTSPR